MKTPPVRNLSASSFQFTGAALPRMSALLLGFILVLGSSHFWTSAVAAELPVNPAPGTHLMGEARFAYSPAAISEEVGDVRAKQVEIKADIQFCKTSHQPSGSLSAKFEGADMTMTASVLDWLIVSPKQIELKGPCLLDDSDGFIFQMKIETSDTGKRRVRLKVWEAAKPSHVVFDNQRDESWEAPFKATGEIVSGDLKIG